MISPCLLNSCTCFNDSIIKTLLDKNNCWRYISVARKTISEDGDKGNAMVSIKDVAREAGVAISTVSSTLFLVSISSRICSSMFSMLFFVGFIFFAQTDDAFCFVGIGLAETCFLIIPNHLIRLS